MKKPSLFTNIRCLGAVVASALMASAGQAQLTLEPDDFYGFGLIGEDPSFPANFITTFSVNFPASEAAALSAINFNPPPASTFGPNGGPFVGGIALGPIDNEDGTFTDVYLMYWDSTNEFASSAFGSTGNDAPILGNRAFNFDGDAMTAPTQPVSASIRGGSPSTATTVTLPGTFWGAGSGVPDQPFNTPHSPLDYLSATFIGLSGTAMAYDGPQDLGGFFTIGGEPLAVGTVLASEDLNGPAADVPLDANGAFDIDFGKSSDPNGGVTATAYLVQIDLLYSADITGACCELATGMCLDNEIGDNCEAPDFQFFPDADCSDASVECFVPGPGACCLSPGFTTCIIVAENTDPVNGCESLGLGDVFVPGVETCVADDPGDPDNLPETCEERGACCTFAGICTDNVTQDDCLGANDVFSADMTCDDVNCVAQGACCDVSRGICFDDILVDQCTEASGIRLVPTAGMTCAEVTCDADPAVAQFVVFESVDISGSESFDGDDDPDNTVFSIDIGANSQLLSFGGSFELTTVAAGSLLSDSEMDFVSTDGDGITLTVFPDDDTAGSTSGGFALTDLDPLGLLFSTASDGIVEIELYEGIDNAADAVDNVYGNAVVNFEYFNPDLAIGACCDLSRGICLDGVAEVDCEEPRNEFTLNEVCANVSCNADLADQVSTEVVDVTGESWGLFGDANNTVISVDLDSAMPAGESFEIIGLDFDVNLTSFSPSILSDLVIAIENSSSTDGLFLTPAVGEDTVGSGNFAGGGLANLDPTLSFFLNADNVVRFELFESAAGGGDDVPAAADTDVSGTVTLQFFNPEADMGVEGDANGDGMVTIADVLFIIARFGDPAPSDADVNGDGMVTIADVLFTIARFGS